MIEQSMTLLSQNEIDTLIAFLNTEKEKSAIDSRVLNQESIDKLIHLIQTNRSLAADVRVTLPVDQDTELELRALYASCGAAYPEDGSCALRMEIGQTGQMQLFVDAAQTGASVCLLPEHMEDVAFTGTSSGWGICIMPAVFVQVAEHFGLSYSTETLELVCQKYARTMYGNEDAVIPKIFLSPR